jgi:hypothetical protein
VTCRLEGGCSIQLSYGANPASLVSVRPLFRTAWLKIIRIGHNLPGGRFRVFQTIGDPMFFGISHRLFLGPKSQPHLRPHVVGARPAHQRINLARTLRFEFENPGPAFGKARLGRRFRRGVNSCVHSRTTNGPGKAVKSGRNCRWSGQQDLNLRPEVPKTSALPGCAIPRSAAACVLPLRYHGFGARTSPRCLLTYRRWDVRPDRLLLPQFWPPYRH